MLGNPTSEAAPRRRQFHRVYYGLALFDVLVVGLGLLLNHQLIDAHDEATRDTLRDFEFLIASFVIVMISMATGYGHRIKKELERRDAERARYIAELERSYQRLAHANDSLIEEVEARSQAEASLRLSEERYALAASGANDGLWDWDLQVDEVYYSPRWKMLLGYADDELGRRPGEWLDRVHPDDQDELRSCLQAAMESGDTFEIEHRVKHRDRSYRWMLARGVATAGGASRRLVGSHSDVTARKEAELALVHDSLHDGLTGLPNRVLFLDRLDHALQRGHRPGSGPFAAIYVDLDRFKQVNDSLGHLAGDELLIKFAELLRRVIRPGDTAARLGGDEFAILLEDVHSEADALTVAKRIQTELEQPIQIDGAAVYTSASIGIAMGRSDYASAAEVLRHADAALYRAKRDGRGRLQVFERSPA
jgi:diguanylate cyclase (GGDEF)-like protein/PAS domain S-box-containing protein